MSPAGRSPGEWLEYGSEPNQPTPEGRLLGGLYVRDPAAPKERPAPQTKPKRSRRKRAKVCR